MFCLSGEVTSSSYSLIKDYKRPNTNLSRGICLSGFQDEYFEVAHARRFGEGGNALAQHIPLQQRRLSTITPALAIDYGKVALACALQLFVDSHSGEPETLRGECM